MNKYDSKAEFKLSTASGKKIFLDRVDVYLRRIFAKNLVNRFWRLYYFRLRKILAISSGAGVLALCMQKKATAQLFDQVETSALDEFLPDGVDIDFFSQFLQLILLAGGTAGIIGVCFQISRGGNTEVWVGVLVGLIAALIGILLWTGAIYGN